MTLSLLAWLDPYQLVCSLRERDGLFRAAGNAGRYVLNLRGPAKDADPSDLEAYVWSSAYDRWPELQTMLSRIEAGADGAYTPGRIYLDMLHPGALSPWQRPAHTRLLMLLRSNPGVRIVGADGQGVGFPVPGQLVATAAVYSTVNTHIDAPYVGLVIEARKVG